MIVLIHQINYNQSWPLTIIRLLDLPVYILPQLVVGLLVLLAAWRQLVVGGIFEVEEFEVSLIVEDVAHELLDFGQGLLLQLRFEDSHHDLVELGSGFLAEEIGGIEEYFLEERNLVLRDIQRLFVEQFVYLCPLVLLLPLAIFAPLDLLMAFILLRVSLLLLPHLLPFLGSKHEAFLVLYLPEKIQYCLSYLYCVSLGSDLSTGI